MVNVDHHGRHEINYDDDDNGEHHQSSTNTTSTASASASATPIMTSAPSHYENNTLGLRRRNVIFPADDNHHSTQQQHQHQHQQQSYIQNPTMTSQHIIMNESTHKQHLIPFVTNSSSSLSQQPANSQHHPHQQEHELQLQLHQDHHHHHPDPTPPPTITSSSSPSRTKQILYKYSKETITGQLLTIITRKLKLSNTRSGSALPGFLSLLLLTMANYMLAPMRDAAALAVGVSHIPTLTLASTVLAIGSSVPVGWLFEAPNPIRWGKSWRDKVGMTRGETQGTSLALFLRCFAICLLGYALTFKALEWLHWNQLDDNNNNNDDGDVIGLTEIIVYIQGEGVWTYLVRVIPKVLQKCGKVFYVAFFLVVHLMKLHSMSLIWGVTSEAMEYEEQAETRERKKKEVLPDGSEATESNYHRNLKATPNQKRGKRSR